MPDHSRRNSPRAPPDAAALRRRALAHLGRYECSVDGLRRVLLRACARAFGELAAVPAGSRADVEATIDQLVRSGLLDDRRFAALKVEIWRRAGRSRRDIAQRLAGAGLDRATIHAALADGDAAAGDEDLEAVRQFVARRRIARLIASGEGDKALAACRRAGFSLALARAAIAEARQRRNGEN